jgi:hypothetical protein
MTIAQIEERLSVLENTVKELKAQLVSPPAPLAHAEAETFLREEDLIPGVEYPVVLSRPPAKVTRVRAIIRRVRPARQDLGLSDAELARLTGEQDHE